MRSLPEHLQLKGQVQASETNRFIITRHFKANLNFVEILIYTLHYFRKEHFDLSFLCENCSERQLKLKKRQYIMTKNIPIVSETKIQNLSLDSQLYSYESLLKNALFLLQMTNAVQGSPTQQRSSPIIQKFGFSCLQVFGASESQILDEDEAFFDSNATFEVKLRSNEEAKLSKEKRSISAASTSFTEEDWDPTTKRRKASNGDQISGEAVNKLNNMLKMIRFLMFFYFNPLVNEFP
jgi:hypothetical protein